MCVWVSSLLASASMEKMSYDQLLALQQGGSLLSSGVRSLGQGEAGLPSSGGNRRFRAAFSRAALFFPSQHAHLLTSTSLVHFSAGFKTQVRKRGDVMTPFLSFGLFVLLLGGFL